MAVAENAGVVTGSSSQNLDNGLVSSDSTVVTNELEKSKPRSGSIVNGVESDVEAVNGDDQSVNDGFGHQDIAPSVPNGNFKPQMTQMRNGFEASGVQNQQMMVNNNGGFGIKQMSDGEDGGESFKRDMRHLEELLSKLNPMAEEFVPPSLINNHGFFAGAGFGYPNDFLPLTNYVNANGHANRRVRLNICGLN